VDLGQPGRDGVATRVATGGPSRRLPVEAVRLSSTAPYSPSWGRTLSRVWVETAEFLRSSLSHGEESLVAGASHLLQVQRPSPSHERWASSWRATRSSAADTRFHGKPSRSTRASLMVRGRLPADARRAPGGPPDTLQLAPWVCGGWPDHLACSGWAQRPFDVEGGDPAQCRCRIGWTCHGV
jgi:hypothetical protein